MSVKIFFKNAFSDIKEDAKAQHEVDKAQFAAAKAESKARHMEAVAMGKTETRKKFMQAKRDGQIRDADKRRAEAEARIDAVKK